MYAQKLMIENFNDRKRTIKVPTVSVTFYCIYRINDWFLISLLNLYFNNSLPIFCRVPCNLLFGEKRGVELK